MLYLSFQNFPPHPSLSLTGERIKVRGKLRYSISAGILLGLVVLTKQSGILLQAFCLAALLWFVIRREKEMIKGLLIIIVVSIAVSGRYFLLNLELVKGFIGMAFPDLIPVLGGGMEDVERLVNARWYVPKGILSLALCGSLDGY